MEHMLLRMFQRQVLLQCDFVLMAAIEFDVANRATETQRVFYVVQNILNAAANISKALWGSGGKLGEQRKPLRDSIGVSDDSPLHAVAMRNNYEHFDERLDDWWEKSQEHHFADLNIGPAEDITAFGPLNTFRSIDSDTADLIFWGDRFNVLDLVREVRRIRPKVAAEAEKHHWPREPSA